MVSGLFVPLIAALALKKVYPQAAALSMIIGGSVTITISLVDSISIPFGLDANLVGVFMGAMSYCIFHLLSREKV